VAGELVAVSLTEKKTTMVFFCSVPIRCVDRFYAGLGWFWASTRAALWAEAGLLRPGRVSPLPSPFLFLFSVLNLLFKFQFDFCLFLQVLKY
jgi:hypothetical protein